jgi:hypothetical protein
MIGHYRVANNLALPSLLAGNARLFEARNTSATVMVIPQRLNISITQVSAGTSQANGLDLFKCTGFTAVDNTNNTALTPSKKRTEFPNAALTVQIATTNTAGMTGGTLVKDANPIWQVTYAVGTAIGTNNTGNYGPFTAIDGFDVPVPFPNLSGGIPLYPMMFRQNEGFEVEFRVVNATSNGMLFSVDFSWAEYEFGSSVGNVPAWL